MAASAQYACQIWSFSRFNRFRNIYGSPNFKKSWSHDPLRTPFDLILHFLPLGPLVLNMHAKFKVYSFCRSQDMEGSQNSKSRSRDPLRTRFDLILHHLKRMSVSFTDRSVSWLLTQNQHTDIFFSAAQWHITVALRGLPPTYVSLSSVDCVGVAYFFQQFSVSATFVNHLIENLFINSVASYPFN